jgi:hypothetical protein
MGLSREGTVSAVGFQSDSHQLVETCLARLRAAAQLDDDPILPTIDLLPECDVIEVDISEVVIVGDSAKELPSAATIVRESIEANLRTQRDVPTLRRALAARKHARKHARWPVVLCGLVALCFGCAALIESPLGAAPVVQHAVTITRGQVANALHATKSLVRL